MRSHYSAPYFSIAFAVTCCSFSILDVGKDAYNKNGWKTLILDLLSIIIPAVFARIAGTLPLKNVLPATNVAGPDDVNFLQLPVFVSTNSSFRFRRTNYPAPRMVSTFGAGVPSPLLNQS